jgi:hypothetical protein
MVPPTCAIRSQAPLEDLTPGLSIVGLKPTAVATVVPIADGTVQVMYP